MRRSAATAAALLATLVAGTAAAGQAAYDLVANLAPDQRRIVVDVAVTLPPEFAGRTVEFLLTSSLSISASSPRVTKLRDAGADGFQGINGSSVELSRQAGISRYRVQLARGSAELTMTYQGVIDFPLETQGEEYTRGFRETPGVIGPEGVYLAGSTLWYPYFGDDLVSFRLAVRAPRGWHLISQGDGRSQGPDSVAAWDSAGPVDEIYLVGGPLQRYAQSAGAAQAEVYLRTPDPALAQKYLDATARYIEMYRGLIGPYPYKKFALVENFWETGYGMPSFTLLGPQIIRFPFILTSSYPHEVLHNWWGNSVFVDYGTGNWAEGLTAYMADHLLKEQQGQGAEYRRDTLKKYRDFVKEDRDFPLAEFRSRHSAATEAVGYGKTMMGFHMLRLRVGDDAFRAALASFYRNQRGRRASFADVQAEFQQVSDEDLARFFRQWVELTGAADLGLQNVQVKQLADAYRVTGDVVQRQAQGALDLRVPLAVRTTDGVALQTVPLTGVSTPFSIDTRNPPVALQLDPEFDVFRLLDARETAPSIGQVFGERAWLAVLPSAAPTEEQAAWRELLAAWENPQLDIDTVLDSEIDALPGDRGVWLLGAGNTLAQRLFAADPLAGGALRENGVTLDGEDYDFASHSLVLVARSPANAERAVGWITVGPSAAFAGMARKLPHYGKYSYLAFAGDEPANVAKGEWVATDSPLRRDLRSEAQRAAGVVAAGELPARKALAELPPVFSRDRLLGHVNVLAAPELEGRGLGSAGLEQAADYIAGQFADIGLLPAGDDGDWFQALMSDTGPDGQPHRIRNVIGYLPGADPAFDGQAVVVSAHYDHLGFGWPDERAAAEPGSVYPGADDNASGVAVLIELARAAVAAGSPPRGLVFLALAGEEAGRLGSRYYVEHPSPVPLTGIRAVVNMDTVGRLGDQPVQILASESATEWPHIFRGAGFTTGIAVKDVPGASESSDQQSFIDAGIPGVQIFTGAHLDYHRPGDTADKVDGDGMVRVATLVREVVGYLAARPEPLTMVAAGPGDGPTAPAGSEGRRRVSFGTVPDFAFQGPGVRVESVVPDSPAAAAGIQAGDVITAIDDVPVIGLRDFSERLKAFNPGDRVTATGEREGAAFAVELELIAR